MKIDWTHLIDNLLWVGCKIGWSAVAPGEYRSSVFGNASCAKHQMFFPLVAAAFSGHVCYVACHIAADPL